MIPNEIVKEYSIRKHSAEERAAAAAAKLYLDYPEFEKLRIKKIELAKQLYGANANERKEIMQVLEEYKLSAESFLSDHGFPADFLSPHYTCSRCKDTGFVDTGHAVKCKCLENRIIEYECDKANVDLRQTFDAFDIGVFSDEKTRQSMSRIHRYIMEYINAIPDPQKRNIILLGKTGLGKTFLLNCAAHLAITKGHTACLSTSYRLISDVMENFREGNAIKQFVNVDLLLIDDLGSEPIIPNVTIENLFSIINERQYLGKCTLIATNLSVEELLDTYGERMFSRLLDKKNSQLIKLEGRDLRLTR